MNVHVLMDTMKNIMLVTLVTSNVTLVMPKLLTVLLVLITDLVSQIVKLVQKDITMMVFMLIVNHVKTNSINVILVLLKVVISV